MATTLYYHSAGQPRRLADALKALAQEYPLLDGAGAPRLEFQPGASPGTVEITRSDEVTSITYGELSDALRGVGAALAGLPLEGKPLKESRPFGTLGIMLDCSRNAVMEVEHLKAWLRRLALFGYNMMMLYTEDTYALPGEPWFGYLRGAYSAQDLREVDDYAARLGIEMVGCIQTLGHLHHILKWEAYAGIKDTPTVLLADEPATYQLIEKMIAHFARCFRSRRIHVGMDEAHDLGRGRHLDRHGWQRPFDIFNRHLARVAGICADHGLRPMIWSDMYFRMGSKTGDYYDAQAVIPADVKAAIPPEADLVYWDYYHDNEDTYRKFIALHRDLGKEPIMASAVWTWAKVWYDRRRTEADAAPCIAACRKEGVKELFFALWGDDGAYCEFDSAWAGLAFAAAQALGEDERAMKMRYAAACGIDYDEVLLAAQLEDFPARFILWDDPIIGLHWPRMKSQEAGYWDNARRHYRRLARKLSRYRAKTEPVDMAHAAALAKYLAAKIEFRLRLDDAYLSRDRAKLEKAAAAAAAMARMTEKLVTSFRRQWLRRNRSAGFEAVEVRLGALRQRYLAAATALRELAAGQRHAIDELDEVNRYPK
jgi:hypothetical protein